ncbi:hypothetical protein SmJEL517_g04812 [Synchytrium microbalum]|uniref:Protein Mpv17 n=1 Tax=Synchytrium microbalum TaxID=1806994 RepID=A0A507BYN7_9FUNG|nr:uncharacterized protein SmJEL517_g04812 [Synchytrium microbalum]TPX31979.1 hypothetical protein SmJEL517_g04812 [Synchytrium microbalum]
MARFMKQYDLILNKYPILVQSLTTGGFFALGDVVAQHLVEHQSKHDFGRTARMTFYGSVIAGPAVAVWYRYLFARTSHIQSAIQATLTRVAADQLLFAPPFIAVFFTGTGILEQRSFEEIKSKLKFGYKDALLANWQTWPAFQAFNFYVVPPLYRSMAVSVVSTGWNSYLSWKNNSSLNKAVLANA